MSTTVALTSGTEALPGQADPSLLSDSSLFPEILSEELPNGLQILAAQDESAPVVSIQYWCATGSVHEGKWLGGGLSHLLEHLLFKGTPTRGNSALAQEVQDLGGHINAYTSFERTVYHIDLPAENWKQALAILTDAVQNSSIPAEEFEPEKEVIRREFAMGDDNPDSVLTKLAFRTVFTAHPYRQPVIGHIDLFNKLTRDDVVAYYRERYAPQNLTLVVCGAVDARALADEAARLWAHEPRRFLPDVPVPEEPAQLSARQARRPFPTEVARVALLHPAPGLHHPDLPALQIVATMLGGGRASLLWHKMVEEEGLAEEVDAFVYAPGKTGLFGLDARCHPDNLPKLIARLREELAAFPARRTEEDLDRAKRLCLTHQIHQLKTMSGKASLIGGGWLAARDPRFHQSFLARLQAVTLADCDRALQAHLRPENESLVELVPASAAAKTEPAAPAAEAIAALPVPAPVPALGPIRAYHLRNNRLPLFTLRGILPGGLLTEPEGKTGLSRLASQLLLKGTHKRNAKAIATEIENLGGVLASDSGNNSASLHLELLAQDWKQGLDLFLDVLTSAVVDGKELETERRKHLAAIALDQDQPMALARDLVRQTLYAGHPYARNLLGTAESVNAIGLDDVRSVFQNVFRRQSLVLASAGPVSPEAWQDEVRQRLTSPAFAPGDAPRTSAPFPVLKGPVRVERTMRKEQAVLQIAFPTVPIVHPDQIALAVLAEALSDLGTRLFVRIREQMGLAYFVSATRFLGTDAGYFCFYAGTDPKKRLAVEAAMLDEIGKMAQGGLTAQEFERARAKMISEEKIDSQNPGGVAATAALDAHLGLGYDWSEVRRQRVASMTLDELNSVVRRYLDRQEYVVASVGPE
ncbi:zinc protease [Verrucomicrobium sp. GAS474]|uniref:M16 family metallopeptidase n=1 Tax=Verrucomicrobium sp. GAS474 TaxID=1882831 RepID=UPI00087D563B|nr:pitrilysin family protein [Verrucomicrobium sp. GAS474]SDU06734.1 zinc protease [Verrucomicrobium sp. GAS474]